MFGWKPDCITGDRTAENQLAFKALAVYAIEDIFPELFKKEENYHLTDLHFKIAFAYFIDPDLLVFIMADMPHWV
eukprot:7360158-Ditylum_brightwellii.AAC.1